MTTNRTRTFTPEPNPDRYYTEAVTNTTRTEVPLIGWAVIDHHLPDNRIWTDIEPVVLINNAPHTNSEYDENYGGHLEVTLR